MHNTHVAKMSVYKGYQWAIYNATVPIPTESILDSNDESNSISDSSSSWSHGNLTWSEGTLLPSRQKQR